VRLDELEGRTVVFAYPRTGRPGEPSPGGDREWDAIPGVRGCTPQACSFRDAHARFAAADTRVVGLSTQDMAYQKEAPSGCTCPIRCSPTSGSSSRPRSVSRRSRSTHGRKAAEILERIPAAGHIILADKGCAGQAFEQLVAGHGARLIRPDRRDEPARHGSLGPVPQWIESVFDTLKGQRRSIRAPVRR
jgi:hypothetical protein